MKGIKSTSAMFWTSSSNFPHVLHYLRLCFRCQFQPLVNIRPYFTKIKIKSFECPKSIRNYWKKIILGTLDLGWRVVCLNQQAIVLYWRLSDFKIWTLFSIFVHVACLHPCRARAAPVLLQILTGVCACHIRRSFEDSGSLKWVGRESH